MRTSAMALAAATVLGLSACGGAGEQAAEREKSDQPTATADVIANSKQGEGAKKAGPSKVVSFKGCVATPPQGLAYRSGDGQLVLAVGENGRLRVLSATAGANGTLSTRQPSPRAAEAQFARGKRNTRVAFQSADNEAVRFRLLGDPRGEQVLDLGADGQLTFDRRNGQLRLLRAAVGEDVNPLVDASNGALSVQLKSGGEVDRAVQLRVNADGDVVGGIAASLQAAVDAAGGGVKADADVNADANTGGGGVDADVNADANTGGGGVDADVNADANTGGGGVDADVNADANTGGGGVDADVNADANTGSGTDVNADADVGL